MSNIQYQLKDINGNNVFPLTYAENVLHKNGNPINEVLEESTATEEFSTTETYSKDDYCIYNNTIYKFTADKTAGEWDSTKVSATTIMAEIESANGDISTLETDVAYIEAFLGIDDNVVGLEVDYENSTFTRCAGAVGLNAGTDFDSFGMYGGRKRCNVADDGTILAYYGDANYKEDGSNGQVMVYQPKFYYKVIPLKYERNSTGIGYHLRKAIYYITEYETLGFKVHPAFYDKNGKELDYVLIGAYEGCIYDTSAAAYITDDAQVMDTSTDKWSSISNVRPASGREQALTRVNMETLAQNRGSDWHLETMKISAMNQLLMIVEFGIMNTQTALGQGVVSQITGSGSQSYASFTGSTSSLGNTSGQATSTNDYAGTAQTTSGKLAVSYRGMENPWGNIWKYLTGVNLWGNGAMGGGQPYICKDFNFEESKNSGNYVGVGFTVSNSSGYISAMGYSKTHDWLFLPSECSGNNSAPIGDYAWVSPSLNDYKIFLFGGAWVNHNAAGGFCWYLSYGISGRGRDTSGRLVYVPTVATT